MPENALDELPPRPAGHAGRCPTCGHAVYLPCLICQARAALAADLQRRRLRLRPDPDEPLRIQLRGRTRKRYERIHARKVQRHLQRLRRTKRLPGGDPQAGRTLMENDR